MNEEDVKKMSYKDENNKEYEIAYSTEVQMKVYQELRKSNRLKTALIIMTVIIGILFILILRTTVITNTINALFC